MLRWSRFLPIHRPALAASMIFLATPVVSAQIPEGLADRAWSISEAVLSKNIQPPTRQQMLLTGLVKLRNAGGAEVTPKLAREVSSITTPEQFAECLKRSWPAPGPPATVGQLESALIEGILSIVPGETELISARDLRVAEQVAGNLYVGVQIALGYDEKTKRASIAQILEGGPADKAGAKPEDKIEAIDGVSVVGLPLKEIVDRLRGALGTRVVVRLRRDQVADPFELTMTRDILPRKTVEGFSKRLGGGWDVRLAGPAPIGYLIIKEIVGSTPVELADFAAQLETEGVRALVLDLGSIRQSDLHATILLADALLDGGAIGRIRSADAVETVRAQPDSLFPRWPIALIVGDTMTAETRWLAAALEDNGQSVVGGVPGSFEDQVRSAVPLPGGEWSVMMTTGRLERGDGRPLATTPKTERRPGQETTIEELNLKLNYALPTTGVKPTPANARRRLDNSGNHLNEARELLSRRLNEAGL